MFSPLEGEVVVVVVVVVLIVALLQIMSQQVGGVTLVLYHQYDTWPGHTALEYFPRNWTQSSGFPSHSVRLMTFQDPSKSKLNSDFLGDGVTPGKG